MKHYLIPLLPPALCVILYFAPPALFAASKTATVSPGKTEVVEFDEDPSGIYGVNIEAAIGHTIKNSDFTAEFKSTTLWQRNSATHYSITYVEKPKPPGVSIRGDFESGSGSGNGYSPNFFKVDVPELDCEPEERKLQVVNLAAINFEEDVKFGPKAGGGYALWMAHMRITALWKDKEYDCPFTVAICQNIKFQLRIRYSDGSSIGVSTNTYLLDGDYPEYAGS